MAGETRNREQIKTTCPRDCYDACGILAVKDDGKLRKLLGDPKHPVAKGALCGKCAIVYNGVFMDEDVRLKTPLKRVGPKGDAKFEAISWDEALETIAAKVKPLLDAGEQASILQTHYTGTVALISGWYPLRFFNRIGATEVDPDTVCNKAGHEALTYMFGASEEGFDPKTIQDSKVVLVWGANPSHAAPHQNKHWLMKSGATVIAVDPVAHETAQGADLHLQLRPGSDAALAFGFMHIAKRDGLIDQAYLAANAIGYDELAGDIDAATPEKTAELTGLSVEDIETAATLYAKGPSLLWLGQGMQRQPRGGNAFRAAATLCVATGNIAKPGAGFCYMNGRDVRGMDGDLLVPEALNTMGPEPASLSHMDLANHLLDSEASTVLFTWNNNILASSPEQARLRQGLEREDLFQVSVELFSTDTTDYADIILPAASFLEFDDLVVPYFDLTLSAQVKVTEPMGESLPNQEIFRRLAKALDLDDEALFEADEDIIAKCLAASGYTGSFADLKEAGTVELFKTPRIQFEDGQFDTPSGKIEIACEAIQAEGMPRLPEPHADIPTAKGKLRVLSPASAWQMNSSYGNDNGILEKLGEAAVIVHADDAAGLGLADGDPVSVTNETGKLELTLKVSKLAQPGMAVIYKGRWPRFDGSQANVNVLNPGEKTDLAESSSVHAIEVTLQAREAAE